MENKGSFLARIGASKVTAFGKKTFAVALAASALAATGYANASENSAENIGRLKTAMSVGIEASGVIPTRQINPEEKDADKDLKEIKEVSSYNVLDFAKVGGAIVGTAIDPAGTVGEAIGKAAVGAAGAAINGSRVDGIFAVDLVSGTFSLVKNVGLLATANPLAMAWALNDIKNDAQAVAQAYFDNRDYKIDKALEAQWNRSQETMRKEYAAMGRDYEPVPYEIGSYQRNKHSQTDNISHVAFSDESLTSKNKISLARSNDLDTSVSKSSLDALFSKPVENSKKQKSELSYGD